MSEGEGKLGLQIVFEIILKIRFEKSNSKNWIRKIRFEKSDSKTNCMFKCPKETKKGGKWFFSQNQTKCRGYDHETGITLWWMTIRSSNSYFILVWIWGRKRIFKLYDVFTRAKFILHNSYFKFTLFSRSMNFKITLWV